MKKRDLYWVNKISIFLLITLVFGAISLFNIVLFNASYMEEEHEELLVFKRQIEWVITPLLEQKNYSKLQKYCDDFKDEDIEFRIFNSNKKLLATSNTDNVSPLLSKNSKIFNKKYNKFKIYKLALKNRKIGVREKYFINNDVYYLEITVSQADVMKTIMKTQKNALTFFIACLMFFIIGLIQVFYTLRNTFNTLEDSVIEVANGNLEEEIEIPKLGLLKELTSSIKKMVQRLKLQITRLSQLEQYKSNFLQNITHEIKTPITAINSAIELIESRNNIEDIDKECFEIIQFQTKSIDKLVNDILCLSEIEVEKTNDNKNFKNFNLNSLLKKVINSFNYANIKIDLSQSEEKINFYGDKDLIFTAISNLLTNAIKYSKTDKIDIFLRQEDKKIYIEVKDYGIGIEPEHLNHIFERFYRVDKNRSRKLGGTGLGLAIVKNIIELHSGSIDVISEVNNGTNFICEFKIDEN